MGASGTKGEKGGLGFEGNRGPTGRDGQSGELVCVCTLASCMVQKNHTWYMFCRDNRELKVTEVFQERGGNE